MSSGVELVELTSLAPAIIMVFAAWVVALIVGTAFGLLDTRMFRKIDWGDVDSAFTNSAIVSLFLVPILSMPWVATYYSHISNVALEEQAVEIYSHYGAEIEWGKIGDFASETHEDLRAGKPVAVTINHDEKSYDGAVKLANDQENVRLLAAISLNGNEHSVQWVEFDIEEIDEYFQTVPRGFHIAKSTETKDIIKNNVLAT